MRHRHNYSRPPDVFKKIVIVDIDQSSFIKMQQRWPFNRKLYADFLKNISGPGSRPLAVAIDIAFFGKSDVPENDIVLENALKKTNNVILGAFLGPKGKIIMPEKIFVTAVNRVGFVSYPRDLDFIIRRVRPFVINANGDKIQYCFILQAVSTILGLDLNQAYYDRDRHLLTLPPPEGLAKNISIPVNYKTKTARVNYFAVPQDFKTVPFWKVTGGIEPIETFKDKIVFLGTATEILHDMHPTPLGLMSGLFINANFLTMVLSQRFLTDTPLPLNFLLFIIFSCLTAFIIYRFGSWKGMIFTASVVTAGFYAAVFCMAKDIFFDFFGLSLVTLCSFICVSIFKRLSIIWENTRLNNLAITDPLTGLFVLRYFQLKLASEIRIARETRAPLSLVIFEIDRIDTINNLHGYQAGDEVLKNVALILKRNSRPSDIISRLEGVRLAVILTHTDLNGAKMYTEKIRKITAASPMGWQDKILSITVSAGVSSLAGPNMDNAENLMKSSEQLLKEALLAGGNKICSAANT